MRHKHTKHRKTETQKHKGLLRGSEQYWHLLQALALSFTLTSNPFLPTSIQQTLCCDCKYLPASDFAFVEVLSFCKRAIKPFPSLIETRAYIWYWKRVHQGIRAADLKQILMESFSWQFDWLVDPFTRLAGLTCNNGWWPNDWLISNLLNTHSLLQKKEKKNCFKRKKRTARIFFRRLNHSYPQGKWKMGILTKKCIKWYNAN